MYFSFSGAYNVEDISTQISYLFDLDSIKVGFEVLKIKSDLSPKARVFENNFPNLMRVEKRHCFQNISLQSRIIFCINLFVSHSICSPSI